MIRLLSPLLLLILLVSPLVHTATITTHLVAQWSGITTCHEYLEFVHFHFQSKYCLALDSIDKLECTSKNNSNLINQALITIIQSSLSTDNHSSKDDHLSNTTLSLFHLTLSTHFHAPLIEAHYQYYTQYIKPSIHQYKECNSWIYFNKKQFCTPSEFNIYIKSHKQTTNLKAKSIDRSCSTNDHLSSSSPSTVAILFVDILDKEYKELYVLLKQLALDKKLDFVINYKRSDTLDTNEHKNIRLSGYGVTLSIKNTEYKVIDDSKDETTTSSNEALVDKEENTASASARANNEWIDVPVSNQPINQALENENESIDVPVKEPQSLDPDSKLHFKPNAFFDNPSGNIIKQLKSSQIERLSLLAAELVFFAENPLQALNLLTSDFPVYAEKLSKQKYLGTFSTAQNTIKQGIYMNGISLEIEKFDVFKMIRLMNSELVLYQKLSKIGLTADTISKLKYAVSTTNEESIFGEMLNVLSPTIMWFNNIEQDSKYSGMSSQYTSLLRHYYPGQIAEIKKNAFNALYAIRLSDQSQLKIFLGVFMYISKSVCIRFGIVPTFRSTMDLDYTIAKCVHFLKLKNTKWLLIVKKFLVDLSVQKIIDSNTVKIVFENHANTTFIDAMADTELEMIMLQVVKFNKRIGGSLEESGALFFNGEYLKLSETYQSGMIQLYQRQLSFLQSSIYTGKLQQSDDILTVFTNLPSTKSQRYLFDNFKSVQIDIFKHVNQIEQTYLSLLPYLHVGDVQDFGIVIITDMDESSSFITAFMQFLKQGKESNFRFSILNYNTTPPNSSALFRSIIRNSKKPKVSQLGVFLLEANDNFQENVDNDIVAEPNAHTENFIQSNSLIQGMSYIVLNEIIYGPLDGTENLDADDFIDLIQSFKEKNSKLLRVIFDGEKRPDLDESILISTILRSPINPANKNSVLSQERTSRISDEEYKDLKSTRVTSSDVVLFAFYIVIDPLTKEAQILAPILETISHMQGVSLRLYLNPTAITTEIPSTFYRGVLDSRFNQLNEFMAIFDKVPHNLIVTQSFNVPNSWVVTSKESVHDLDNLRITSSTQRIQSKFELRNILVEAYSKEVGDRKNGRRVPAGIGFTLGTENNPILYDTITMENLGYVQFKASPGLWNMKIRTGKSFDTYSFRDVSDQFTRDMTCDDNTISVTVDSFEGVVIVPTVQRRLGMETADVLMEIEIPTSNYWTKLKKAFHSFYPYNGRVFGEEIPETINIFSVASGHLYERFLSIMMLSVMNHTTSNVKFWLIEDFLSPSFKAFLPRLSQEYKFEFELVTYKWPSWLRAQSEKQRTIWGYKILFLDVLFPLSLQKIIFVDADQIVRVDLKELIGLDLKGAVYGYTPFCDSRSEMDEFRFWTSGYWKSHLRGRPYHISALYVIDLKKFRQFAAGDRLRGQYQALSSDPNSLANLDQDLPNNMIHEIPMFSLPNDWLWCETWCSDADLKFAKTIDLCNNPLTKEPKLDRARRIIPEWDSYDSKVSELKKTFKDEIRVQIKEERVEL